MDNNFDLETAIQAGKQLASGEVIKINGHPLMLVANGLNVKEFPDLKEKLERINVRVPTEDANSFIEYFNKFADDHSAVFVSDEEFEGILDYHSENAPQFCQHKVSFKPQKTSEWQKWLSSNGKKFNQEDFAYFIEDCAEEIQSPPGAEMLEIATTLKAKSKINFSSAKSLSNGQTQLSYLEEIDGSAGPKGELKIPEVITLGMRLYKGGDGYQMKARFRYRINQGSISFWYELIRPTKTVDSAVDDITKQLKEHLKTELFIKGRAIAS